MLKITFTKSQKFCDFFIFEKSKMNALAENKTVLAHNDFFEILTEM